MNNMATKKTTKKATKAEPKEENEKKEGVDISETLRSLKTKFGEEVDESYDKDENERV